MERSPRQDAALLRARGRMDQASDATAQALDGAAAKGAMPPLVMVVDDCKAAYGQLAARGVEFTQEPLERFGSVDASFRDPSGNGWKMIQARQSCTPVLSGRARPTRAIQRRAG